MTNKIISIIPIAISVISLIFSLSSTFLSWKGQRFKLDFEMVKWFGASDGKYPFFIWLYVTNYSTLPCSILDIKIENERCGKVIEGVGMGGKKLISTTKTNDNKVKEEFYSLNYPVNISPCTSIGGNFHVFSEHGFHQFEDDIVKLTIRTTRGTLTKKVFMDRGKNIFRIWQHKDASIKIKIDKHSDGSDVNYLKDDSVN